MEIEVTKLVGARTVYQVRDEKGGFLELSKKDWERILRVIRLMERKKTIFDEMVFEGGEKG